MDFVFILLMDQWAKLWLALIHQQLILICSHKLYLKKHLGHVCCCYDGLNMSFGGVVLEYF